ncbi:MAG: HAD family hydrolase, partial [Nitrosomonadales bacterium]|nr:HAD family hydrolase [Nitrosomonadales bacterium]
IDFLLDKFASEIHQGLLHCKQADGLYELRERYPSVRWMVLSGGDQQELRVLFKERQLDKLFDAGIFGSPDNKDVVLQREIGNRNIQMPALFLGDSKYDHQASTAAGLDFIFVAEWTEVDDWQEYCRVHAIQTVASLATLLDEWSSTH